MFSLLFRAHNKGMQQPMDQSRLEQHQPQAPWQPYVGAHHHFLDVELTATVHIRIIMMLQDLLGKLCKSVQWTELANTARPVRTCSQFVQQTARGDVARQNFTN